MRINSTTAIATERILLVPYEVKHVTAYHEWMKDEDIQAATASEPLTLEEEFQMQRSWRCDADKLTFIICHPVKATTIETLIEENDTPDRMVGDINLFLSASNEDETAVVGEIELMIAEPTARRKGLGREALIAFVKYITDHLHTLLEEFKLGHPGTSGKLGFLRVKVGSENHSSLKLFHSVGFEFVSEKPNVFGEVELRVSDLQAFLEKVYIAYPLVGYKELLYQG